MLDTMHGIQRYRAGLVVLLTTLLGACSLPPLHRSVVVETNRQGVPVHARGEVANGHYTVMRGDTLYSIAFRSSVDYHDLARWNGIGAPYIIHPGQQLRLTRPRNMPVTPPSPPVFQPVEPGTTSTADAGKTPATGVFQPLPSAGTAATATGAAGAAGLPAPPVSTVVAVAGETPVSTPPPVAAVVSIPSSDTRKVGGVTWRWPAGGKLLSGFEASSAIPGISIAGAAGDPVRAAADGVVVYSGNGLVGYGELVIIKHNDDYLSAYGHNRKRLVKEGEHVRAGQLIAEMGSSGAPRNELEFQVRYKGKPVDPLNYLPTR